MVKQMLSVTAQDVTGQKQFRVDNLPWNSTVGEMARDLESLLDLPLQDSKGRPVTYQVRRSREGRHLQSAERVGETLKEDDCITLQPNIQAG